MRLVKLRRAGLCEVAALFSLVGCAGLQKSKDAPPESAIELAYDDGAPSERPLLPPAAFEWLIKFEPNLPAYRPLRLRMLLAQPGPLRLVVYAADAAGRPSTPLYTIERSYAPELSSNGSDGKWLLESLPNVPLLTAPLFVGVSVPTPGNDAARLWATATEKNTSGTTSSAHVFQRDAEPSTALQSSRLSLVPIVRLELTPAAPPAQAPVAAPAAPPAQAPAAAPAAPPVAAPTMQPPAAAPRSEP